jgi:micrococcal nuclease
VVVAAATMLVVAVAVATARQNLAEETGSPAAATPDPIPPDDVPDVPEVPDTPEPPPDPGTPQPPAPRAPHDEQDDPSLEPAGGWRVIDVIDGDTVDVRGPDGTVERIRVIGIDTPERGECGYGEAAIALADLVRGRDLTLVPGARDDSDRYGRLLRYLDVDGTDAGLELLHQGLAIARYDSRDGYGGHPRERAYVAADAAMPNLTCDDDGGESSLISYANCAAARAAGAAPVRRGDPGYGPHLDRDGDGVGCE